MAIDQKDLKWVVCQGKINKAGFITQIEIKNVPNAGYTSIPGEGLVPSDVIFEKHNDAIACAKKIIGKRRNGLNNELIDLDKVDFSLKFIDEQL